MEENSSGFCTLLPLEVRFMIYKLVPYQDSLSLRLVSKQVKTEADDCLSYHATLDQNYRRHWRLCQLRLEHIKVSCLTQNQRKGITAAFRYPDLVKKLIFDGKISIGNLNKLLTTCKNTEHIVFTHEALAAKNLMKSDVVLRRMSSLERVNTIEVQYLRYPGGDGLDESEDVNVVAILNSYFPRLHTFKLSFSLRGSWTKLIDFLQRHSETLKVLELNVGDAADSAQTRLQLGVRYNEYERQQTDMSRLKKLNLKEFKFKNDIIRYNPRLKNIILRITSNQHNLETFHFCTPGEFTPRLMYELVDGNSETIREICIENLQAFRNVGDVIPIDPRLPVLLPEIELNPLPPLPVDMSRFHRCQALKHLTIAGSCENGRNDDSPSLIIFNVGLLPSTLETVYFGGFLARSRDLILMSKNCLNLRKVSIVDGGKYHYSAVIRSFLKNCNSLEYFNVRPVLAGGSNGEGWYREVDALNQIFHRFMGTPYDMDDLDGLEALIKSEDKDWIAANIKEDPTFT